MGRGPAGGTVRRRGRAQRADGHAARVARRLGQLREGLMTIHFLVPAGFADQPSGGNVYDRRVQAGLVGLGLDVVTHEVSQTSAPVLPDGALVLVDGLVASWWATSLRTSSVRLVP